jgi:hypothetical protein
MKFRVAAASVLAVAGVIAAPTSLFASEGDYIGLFGGAWSGFGTVLNNAQPWQVSCRALGQQPSANHLLITGTCSVFLVSVAIAADVTYDPSSGRYSGTYVGGDMSAHIPGKRQGDTVDFTMTWARPIDGNGDTHARLTIVNSGTGNLRIVIDNLKANGPEERSSDLLLSQT